MGYPVNGSLLDMAISNKVKTTLDAYFAGPKFKSWLSTRIKWTIQGFEPGYDMKDREAFTATVASRIYQKARRPVYLFGYRIWRRRERPEWCAEQAERIVTEFIRGEKVKFGDPAYDWKDGSDLADDDMSYWEACP